MIGIDKKILFITTHPPRHETDYDTIKGQVDNLGMDQLQRLGVPQETLVWEDYQEGNTKGTGWDATLIEDPNP